MNESFILEALAGIVIGVLIGLSSAAIYYRRKIYAMTAQPPATQWSLEVDNQRFEAMKSQERFWQLVALSRAVSALRFVHYALLGHKQEEDSPRANRTRLNSFFFNSALLFEALLLVERLGKHYRDIPSFSDLRGILKDPVATELRNSSLAPIRNRQTFHFDEAQFGVELAKASSAHRFISAQGETNADVHYELADLCTLATFAASSLDAPDLVEVLTKRVAAVTEVALRFMDAAEAFIADVLKQDGWEMH